MRIEGHGDRFRAERASAAPNLAEQPLVAAMDSVEVADAGDGGTEVGGDLVEVVEDVHDSNLDRDHQAVVGEADVGREGRVYLGVQNVMRHVGEPGAARSDFIDPGGCLLHIGVAWVSAFAKGVDYDDLDSLEEREA